MAEHLTPVITTRFIPEENRDVVVAGHPTITLERIVPLAKHGFRGMLDNALHVSEVQDPQDSLTIPVKTLQEIDALPEHVDEAVLQQRSEMRRRVARHIAGLIGFHYLQDGNGETMRQYDDDVVAILLDEERSGLSDESRALLLEYLVRKGVSSPAVNELHDVIAYRRVQSVETYNDLHRAFKDLPQTDFNRGLRDEVVYDAMARHLASENQDNDGALNALGFYSQHAGTAEYAEQIELLANEALRRCRPDIQTLQDFQEIFSLFPEPNDYVAIVKDEIIADRMKRCLAAQKTELAWAFFQQRAGTEVQEEQLEDLGNQTVVAHATKFLTGDAGAEHTHRIVRFIDANINDDNRVELEAIREQIIAKFERVHDVEFVLLSLEAQSDDSEGDTTSV